jgi:hypothetical protein
LVVTRRLSSARRSAAAARTPDVTRTHLAAQSERAESIGLHGDDRREGRQGEAEKDEHGHHHLDYEGTRELVPVKR